MGRTPCCAKEGLNKGAWTAAEDRRLAEYVEAHGEGKWRNVPNAAGLRRCGKSCRLRWLNYLRPDIKRGNISPDEEDLIIRLHKLLGNRWSLIAGRLPGRTDNEIKNYWNTNLSKKLGSSDKNNIKNKQQQQPRPPSPFHVVQSSKNHQREPEEEESSLFRTASEDQLKSLVNTKRSQNPDTSSNGDWLTFELETDFNIGDLIDLAEFGNANSCGGKTHQNNNIAGADPTSNSPAVGHDNSCLLSPEYNLELPGHEDTRSDEDWLLRAMAADEEDWLLDATAADEVDWLLDCGGSTSSVDAESEMGFGSSEF